MRSSGCASLRATFRRRLGFDQASAKRTLRATYFSFVVGCEFCFREAPTIQPDRRSNTSKSARFFATRLVGFFLLIAGWSIDLAALALLKAVGQQMAFILAGTAVEVLGLVFVFRSHLLPRGDRS